jgi:Ca2+-binding EF-hand superfamily protein
MANEEYKLKYECFIKVLRALGLVVKNKVAYERFMSRKEKEIGWEGFLEIYCEFRNYKGSYKEVETAVNELDKEYKGHWELLMRDLTELGDVLSER